MLGPGMTFVDVGAHIGLLTLAGARSVGNTGEVYAIEPGPSSIQLLVPDDSNERFGSQYSGKTPSRCARRSAERSISEP